MNSRLEQVVEVEVRSRSPMSRRAVPTRRTHRDRKALLVTLLRERTPQRWPQPELSGSENQRELTRSESTQPKALKLSVMRNGVSDSNRSSRKLSKNSNSISNSFSVLEGPGPHSCGGVRSRN